MSTVARTAERQGVWGGRMSLLACSNAGCSEIGRQRCVVCKNVLYCSKKCQKKDWKARHKSVCVFRKAAVADLVAFGNLVVYARKGNWFDIVKLDRHIRTTTTTTAEMPDSAAGIVQRLWTCSEQEHRRKALTITEIFADAYLNRAQYRKGLHWATLSMAIAGEIEPGPASLLMGTALMNISAARAAMGCFEQATADTQHAIHIFQQARSPQKLVEANTQMGFVCLEQQKQKDARPFLQTALDIALTECSASNPDEESAKAAAYGEMSRYHSYSHEYDKALVCTHKKHAIITKLHRKYDARNHHDVTWCHMQIGILTWAQTRALAFQSNAPRAESAVQELLAARAALQRALTCANTCEHRLDQEQSTLMLSFVVYDIGNTDEALDLLTSYLKLVTERSDTPKSQDVLHCRASAYCQGCFQLRDTHKKMGVCSNCKVARFCSKDCQRRESVMGNSRCNVAHLHMCVLLNNWHRIKRVNVSTAPMQAPLFLVLTPHLNLPCLGAKSPHVYTHAIMHDHQALRN